jgi:serine/threonine protein kinase
MELIDGPSLEEYLKNMVDQGKWPSFEESKKIVEQLLEALEYAHDKSRVHGDIKPANIFLPVTGEAKLGDFGVAKILGNPAETKEEYPPGYARRLGSSSCAAPEILKGQPRDFQSDLFSVGIVAYLLLIGQHPFMHKSGLIPIPELIKSDTFVPKRPKELVESIPEKYDNIVMRLLEKDKSKRYQKAREVLDEWREKIEKVQCPTCGAENPILNKFCGQCGNALGLGRQSKSQPEKDLNTSFALFAAGRSQDAIKLIQQTLVKNKDFARGWSQLGFMLNYERRYEEAEDACSRSIKIDSTSSSPYQTRGFARSNLGRFKDAIEDFTQAYNKEKDEKRQSMILYNRGYSKRLDGNFKEAYEDALLALELDETNSKARRLKESLEPLV